MSRREDASTSTSTDILDASGRWRRIDLQLLDAHGCVLAEDVVAARRRCRRSTTRAMDGYAVRAADVAGASRATPGRRCRSSATSRPGSRRRYARRSPGTAVRIMTGAPVPRGRRRRRAGRVDRRRRWPQVRDHRGARRPAQHVRRRRRGRRARATCVLRGRHACSGPAQLGLLAAVGRDRGRGAPAPARRRALHRHRAGRARARRSAPARSTTSTRYVLTAAAREAGAHRLPGRHRRRTTRARCCDALEDQLIRADLVRHQRRRQRGRLRRGQGGAVAARHGRVRARSRCSPACRRASAPSARTATPIFTLPGNPVCVVRLVRGVRAPGDPPDARRRAAAPRPTVARRAAPTALSSPAGHAAVRPRLARRRATGATSSRPVGGQGSHLVGDLAQANALIVVPEDVTEVAGRRAGRRCWCWSGDCHEPRREPRLTHVDEPRRRADGRRRPARTSRRARRRAAGRVLVSAEVVGAAARRRRAQGRRARRRPDRRHHGAPSAPPTWSRCATRSRSTASTVDLAVDRRRASRSPRPCAPPTAPASRWRR